MCTNARRQEKPAARRRGSDDRPRSYDCAESRRFAGFAAIGSSGAGGAAIVAAGASEAFGDELVVLFGFGLLLAGAKLVDWATEIEEVEPDA